ncbi:hypothetical protein [Burkholderia sp. LMG 32019]|uniref:hypothetical protein n=1 Tax=Burkholderia sp. LMG 32019 TaxID=3158173 RepID=UPI003C2F2396
MHKSPELFAELLADARPRAEVNIPLTNLTFFTGAGFSKSWDINFPVGDALFSFKHNEWAKHGEALHEFLSLNNYQPFDLDITASLFKDIVYQIGMMRKYPVIRPRYIDDQNLDAIERHLRYLVRKKFEQTAPLFFENSDQKLEFSTPISKSQGDILSMFRIIQRSGDGSQGIPQGLRANYVSTNYDYVLDAILDNILAPDDSHTLYTYRGVTPTRYSGRAPAVTIHDNWLVSNLLKINGGFEVFKNGDGFDFEYRNSKSDDELRENPPQLMLASREQDYTQKYFHALFPKIVRLLQETRILVVVGYSMPEEDALVRLILKQFAEDRIDGSKKILFYVDKSEESTQREKVSSVFPHTDELHGLTVIPYSGSFADWCAEVVKKYKRLTR